MSAAASSSSDAAKRAHNDLARQKLEEIATRSLRGVQHKLATMGSFFEEQAAMQAAKAARAASSSAPTRAQTVPTLNFDNDLKWNVMQQDLAPLIRKQVKKGDCLVIEDEETLDQMDAVSLNSTGHELKPHVLAYMFMHRLGNLFGQKVGHTSECKQRNCMRFEHLIGPSLEELAKSPQAVDYMRRKTEFMNRHELADAQPVVKKYRAPGTKKRGTVKGSATNNVEVLRAGAKCEDPIHLPDDITKWKDTIRTSLATLQPHSCIVSVVGNKPAKSYFIHRELPLTSIDIAKIFRHEEPSTEAFPPLDNVDDVCNRGQEHCCNIAHF